MVSTESCRSWRTCNAAERDRQLRVISTCDVYIGPLTHLRAALSDVRSSGIVASSAQRRPYEKSDLRVSRELSPGGLNMTRSDDFPDTIDGRKHWMVSTNCITSRFRKARRGRMGILAPVTLKGLCTAHDVAITPPVASSR